MGNENVKLLFRFFSDILEKETVETMWAIPIDINKGFYKIESIPFYAPLVASDDIVFAEYDENEGMLTYKSTVEYSGNSTIAVVIMLDTADVNAIREEFKELGCMSEKVNDIYFAMEIPAALNYHLIKEKLDELENLNFIEYSEPCLSNIHNNQI
jgi:hypothetical protein